jgi:tetratricopeptide (TPR) repeat protein
MSADQAFIQARLQEAARLHGARRLAEAELIYKQVLATRPDFTEVQIQCALAQLGQGKHADAEALLRAAVAQRPSEGAAHYYLGDLLSMQGKLEEAAGSYRRAIALQPNQPAAHNNLGNALLLLGQFEQAEASYLKTLALKPGQARTHNNLGLIALHRGELEKARAAFTQALALAPAYAEAQNNLGISLQKLGRVKEAEAAFRAAIRLAPNFANAFLNLSGLLCDTGRAREAEAAARSVMRLAPSLAEGQAALGNALRAQGKLGEAEDVYRRALELRPDFAEGQRLLAMAVAEQGRLDDAFALFRRHAAQVHAKAPADAGEARQKHDREQQDWRGRDGAEFFLGDGSRMDGTAVNPANRNPSISEAWQRARPQLVVVDDFLTPEALQGLRRFCLESTIWQKPYEGGYLGAFPEHGFAPPLLAQIAEEMRGVYPDILLDHPLLHFWAFKYDSALQGIKAHADFAAVNVNFWITPDEANLDPEHGGLLVWDAVAPLDWDFARYNAADKDIQELLEKQTPRAITVPYRCNRAVIFDSDLFHQTDVIRFKPGYENRRINVTLLFGRRDLAHR